MTSTWIDEADLDFTESAETNDYDSPYVGDESYDDESTRSRRRERARRIARARELQLAKSRQRTGPVAASPTRSAPPATPAARAIRTLDLETKVQDDVFRQALAAQERRMSRNEYAHVLGLLTSSFVQIFNSPENKIARTALQAGHLLLLSPQRRGTGAEAVIKDPRTLAAAGLAGMLFIQDRRDSTASVRHLNTLGPSDMAAGGQDVFLADVLDGNGKPVTTPVVWTSDNPSVATIDSVTGKVTGVGAGVAVITATAGGVTRRVRLRVTPATGTHSGSPSGSPTSVGR